MYSFNFENWVKEKLIPNIIEKLVTVFDYEPHHFVQGDKPQSKSSVRAERGIVDDATVVNVIYTRRWT